MLAQHFFVYKKKHTKNGVSQNVTFGTPVQRQIVIFYTVTSLFFFSPSNKKIGSEQEEKGQYKKWELVKVNKCRNRELIRSVKEKSNEV
jgi:hypothetical protein